MNQVSQRTHSIIGRMPHFYQSGEESNHLYRLVNIFAQLVDEAEEDLLKVMRAHWSETANNENSKGLDTNTKGDLDKILTLFLENLGGTSLLRQTNRPAGNGEDSLLADNVYRDRMKGLIQVILGGPSTKSGLIEIVSANLGILGNDAAARYARDQIQIREFLPETETGIHNGVQLLQRIEVVNPNPDAVFPEIIIRIPSIDFPMIRPRIVHAGSGSFWQFNGLITGNEELIFFRDSNLFYKGESRITVVGGNGLLLQPGINELYLDAGVGTALGTFDETLFNYSLFDAGMEFPLGLFDQGHFDEAVFVPTVAVANISIRIEKLHPASFSVSVPWDSPGYTAKFTLKPTLLSRLATNDLLPTGAEVEFANLSNMELSNMSGVLKALWALENGKLDQAIRIVNEEAEPSTDMFEGMPVNPRSQILYIVNKVKAAGVMAVVSYQKRFTETHQQSDLFHLSGQMKPIIEDNDPYDENLIIASVQQPYPGGLDHELRDSLLINGVFDFTGFDSLNAFA